jgi:hypothetical protein
MKFRQCEGERSDILNFLNTSVFLMNEIPVKAGNE